MASKRFAPLLALSRKRILGALTSPSLIRASFFDISSNATFHIHRLPIPSFFSGFCHWAEATIQNNDLNQSTDDAVTVDHILHKVNHASSRGDVFHTNFLSRPLLIETLSRIEKLSDVEAIPQGGYPEAVRCRLSVGKIVALKRIPDIVVGLCITGNFVSKRCSHGDFLGAILGMGIQRDMVGDIILQDEKGAQVLVVPELVSFLLSSLDKVGNVPVSCREMPLHELEYTPKRELLKSFEASLRLDAVASAGFKMSRSKMSSLIEKKDVSVNWTTQTKNSATIRSGDFISVKGKERVIKIGEIETSKKGKFIIEYIPYL